jgi:hypothetical protein
MDTREKPVSYTNNRAHQTDAEGGWGGMGG